MLKLRDKLTFEDFDFKAENAIQSKYLELVKENLKKYSRPSCPFGKVGCKRFNPQHFEDEAHPGDSDYLEIENNDDDLPECEYGVDCYRKNPLHLKEYKHTLKPRPSRPKKPKREENEHDYDSSFIDDEEEEEVDISDDEESVDEWVPDEED